MCLPGALTRWRRASKRWFRAWPSWQREQGNAVQELAVADLLRQKERLAAYGTQARFAVAQIYDRASTAREDGRAPQ